MKYAKAEEIKNRFHFLENIGFVLTREETLNYGSYVEYKGNGIKVYLGFDYKGYSFNFLLFRGEDLKYSDESYGNEIKSFCDLFKKYDLELECISLNPNYINGYEQALNNNAMLLEKYGDKVLKGKEWI